MAKILHTIPALDGGGADRVIFDYTVRMIPDLEFDFIVHSEDKGILEEELLNKGCQIFHVPSLKTSGLFKYIKSLYRIMRNNQYDIIHVSQGYWGFAFIIIAFVLGIKIRIAHAHMAYVPENRYQTIKRKIFSALTRLFATDLFACGIDSACWMWGEKNYKNNNIHIMSNAIDGTKFIFNSKLRQKLRQEWKVESNFVIGNVGRLECQKNQLFLVNLFSEILKIAPHSRLMLIGRGSLESQLREKVHELGIDDFVIFTGVRDDVHKLLNLMDVFVLPSLFEGFPITLIEAQMNGLPIVVSSNITNESKFSELYTSLPLNIDLKEWAKEIVGFDDTRVAVDKTIQMQRDVNYLAPIQKSWYVRRLESLEKKSNK